MCWRRDRLPTPIFLGFPGSSPGKESTCNAGDPGSIPGLRRSPGEGIGYPLQYSWVSLVAQTVAWRVKASTYEFSGGSISKKSACNVGDPGLIACSGRFPWRREEEDGYPLQYSCLENSMDKGTWWAIVHGIAKSQTWLSNQHFSPSNKAINS